MLTFNDLLELGGIDTGKVRLVRHQDDRLRRVEPAAFSRPSEGGE